MEKKPSTGIVVNDKKRAARAAGACAAGACELLEELGQPGPAKARRAVLGILELLGPEGTRALAAGDLAGAVAVVLTRRQSTPKP